MLICDEPTSALDMCPSSGADPDLLRDLQRELGIAYLFITHNFSVVEYLADRIAVMHGGRIVELDDTATVLRHPRHDVTRRLLAAVPRLDFGITRAGGDGLPPGPPETLQHWALRAAPARRPVLYRRQSPPYSLL